MTVDLTLPFILLTATVGLYVMLVQHYGTALLGFSLMNAFQVGSASLSALLVTSLFQTDQAWMTEAHVTVFNYSALGLIGMGIGIWIAWRPLAAARMDAREIQVDGMASRLPSPGWANPRFAYLCLGVGAIAFLLVPFAYSIPTIRAIWSGYLMWTKIGVLIALAHGVLHRDYKPFVLSLIIFLPLSIVGILGTGFAGGVLTFLLQLVLVGAVSRKASLKSIAILLVATAALAGPLVGWLEMRSLVREGRLAHLGQIEAATLLLEEWGGRSNPLEVTPDRLTEVLLERVDMSTLLAAQVEHQPLREPFRYGGTVTSDLAVSLVPRFLWPDKPTSAGGSAFVSRFTGLFFPEGTSVGLPYQFELYANGGPLLVVVGLFCIGWLVARLELWLFMSGAIPLRRLMPVIALTLVLSGGGERFSLTVMTTITAVLGAYVLARGLEHWSPAFVERLIGTSTYRASDAQGWPDKSIPQIW